MGGLISDLWRGMRNILKTGGTKGRHTSLEHIKRPSLFYFFFNLLVLSTINDHATRVVLEVNFVATCFDTCELLGF